MSNSKTMAKLGFFLLLEMDVLQTEASSSNTLLILQRSKEKKKAAQKATYMFPVSDFFQLKMGDPGEKVENVKAPARKEKPIEINFHLLGLILLR